MKKILTSLVMTSLCISLYAGDNDKNAGPPDNKSIAKTNAGKDITDGGFFVHVVLAMPTMNYAYPPGLDNDDSEYKFGIGPGRELGNMFKINDVGNNAFGIKAVWMASMYTSFNVVVNDTLSFDYGAFQGSVLRVGPYFSLG